MKIKEKTISKILVPERLVHNKRVCKITGLESKYIIKKYTVKIVNGKIDSVYLDSVHPNCDPNTKQFCIPNILRQQKFNKKTQPILENIIITFNLDDCYFKPWGDISYTQL